MPGWPLSTQNGDEMIPFVGISLGIVLVRQFIRRQLDLVPVEIPDTDGLVAGSRCEDVRLRGAYSQGLHFLISQLWERHS